jgi:hypothetical protein
VSATAGAAPCPPSAWLTGDPALVADVRAMLDARGIAVEAAQCPNVLVRLERRDDGVAISIDGRDPRSVGDSRTAATVIESWVRTDVGDPLLAPREVASEPLPPAAEVRDSVVRVPSDWRGVGVFALGESSFGSDRTGWVGADVGACVTLGPMCATARLRFAAVFGGTGVPQPFHNLFDRRSVEVLIGGDVPFAVGKFTISPGFAGGVGSIYTRRSDKEGKRMAGEVGGLRADAHASVIYPLTKRFALELAVALELTQSTHIDVDPTVDFSFPDPPPFLARLGFGLRYGGL